MFWRKVMIWAKIDFLISNINGCKQCLTNVVKTRSMDDQ
jgi:hypothetical protein